MSVFRNGQFLKLWGNQILLQIGFNLASFTALLLIDSITSSRFALAQFYAAITLPAFLVGIYAGSIIDLTNRKRLMLITDAILTILFLGYILVSHSYWGLLLIAFFAASVAQFFVPAEAATIPALVSEKELANANALFLFTALGSVMIGYGLAGPLIQLFGGLGSPYSTSASFALASSLSAIGFVLLSSLNSIETKKPKILVRNVLVTTWRLTREVFLEVKRNIKIALPIGLLTLMEFNIGMMAIIFIDFVKIYLKLPSTAISYFLILPLIIGLAIGVKILKIAEKYLGRGRTIFLGIVIFGVMILGLGVLAGVLQTIMLRYLTAVTAALVGISAVFLSVHARTVLQENTPPAMLGRVFAFVTVAISAVVPIPILLFSLLGEKVDVATVFIVFGGSLFFLAILLEKILVRYIN